MKLLTPGNRYTDISLNLKSKKIELKPFDFEAMILRETRVQVGAGYICCELRSYYYKKIKNKIKSLFIYFLTQSEVVFLLRHPNFPKTI